MSDLAAVIRHFPMHELTIRRLYLRTPEFRSLCDDYATASCALDRWHADEDKARDFRQLIDEIAAEIEEFILGNLAAVRQNQNDGEV